MKKFLPLSALAVALALVQTSVHAQCTASFTWTQTANNVISFTNTSTGNCGTPSYLWDFGDGGYDWTANPVHTYNIPGVYNVCFTLADSTNQNIYSQYCTTDTVTGNVICTLQAYITTVQHPSCSSCADGSLNVYTSGGSSPFTYSWSNGGTTSTISNLAVGNYTVTVTDTNNCTSTVGVFLDTVAPPPSCNVTFTHTQSQANVVDFAASSNINYPFYVWDFGDNTSNVYGPNPSHTFAYTGTYHVCVDIFDTANNCANQWCDTVTVWGNSASCVAQFYSYTDSLNPDTVFVVNQSTGAQPVHYTWTWGDNTMDTIPYPIHNYAQSGTYQICLVINDNAGCVDSFCLNQQVRMIQQAASAPKIIRVVPGSPAGIHNMDANAGITLFPNPAENELNLESATSLIGRQYVILDMTGRVLKNERLSDTHIDIRNLTPGIYFIRISDGKNSVKTLKFVKE